MTLGRHIESRGILSLLPRLSLRAKGVAALAVPMAALFAALFGIYWAEQAAHLADQATVRAHDTQIELLQLRIIMLDTGSAISDYLATGEPRFLPATGYRLKCRVTGDREVIAAPHRTT